MATAPSSIILYRNRSEMEIDRMIWEGNGAEYFGYVVTIGIAFVLMTMLLQKFLPYRKQNFVMPVAIVASIPLGILLGKALGWLILWV